MYFRLSIMREPECIVQGFLAHVLHLTSFFGLTPLRFDKIEEGYRISVSLLSYIYGCSLTMIVDLIILYGLKMKLNIEGSQVQMAKTEVPDLVHITSVIKTMFIITVAVITSPFRITKFKMCFNKLSEIRFQINPEGTHNETGRKNYILLTSYLLFGAFLVASDLYIYYRGILRSYVTTKPIILAEMTLNYIQVWMVSLLGIEIMTIAFGPYLVIRNINDNLAIMSKNNFRKMIPTQMKSVQDNIRRLISCYSSVSDVIRQINEVNGFVLLSIIVSCLITIVVSAYYLIDYLFNQRLSTFWIFVQALWLLYGFINLVILVEPGYQTEQEVTRTSVILSQLLNEVSISNPVIEKELELFHRMLQLNDFSHQPLGTCQLSRSLAVTILGSVTTYLVVIVQINFGV